MTYPEAKDVEIPQEIVEKWQNLVDIMAEVIDVPSGLIMRFKPPKIEVFRSSESEGNPYEAGDTEDLAGLYCEKVIKSKDKLLVPNAQKEERWKDNPDVELGMISYLGFPLEWPDGDIFGTICVLDSEENRYSENYVELMRQFRKLVESQLGLIYQRNELERQIREREKVEEKEDFLHSLLRHDVRNKLQVILGYVEMLEDFDLSEKAERFLSLAEEGIEGGIEIIEKVRTLREAREEEISEVDVEFAIQNAVDQYEDSAREKGIEIDVDCPEEGCKVLGGSLLNRVFSNLIENAVQHSGGNEVRIRGKVEEDEVRCIIEDDGKGIPDEEKDRIFNKGYTAGEEGGTGLGMFLVETLLETYKGSIEVSDSELGGARFDVCFQKA